MTFLDVSLCIGAIIVAPRLLALATIPWRAAKAVSTGPRSKRWLTAEARRRAPARTLSPRRRP